MADYECGCKPGARFLDDRCNKHGLWGCHKETLPPGYPYIENGKECPPCFRDRFASVALGPGLSQLKYQRIKGHRPDMRGRENY